MNILLVEDDVTLAQSVAEAIRARGWHVDVSHRGEPVAKSVLHARKELNETFLIVSHDMDFILACCDRVALMKGGKMVALGTPQEVLKDMTQEDLEGDESDVCEV